MSEPILFPPQFEEVTYEDFTEDYRADSKMEIAHQFSHAYLVFSVFNLSRGIQWAVFFLFEHSTDRQHSRLYSIWA